MDLEAVADRRQRLDRHPDQGGAGEDRGGARILDHDSLLQIHRIGLHVIRRLHRRLRLAIDLEAHGGRERAHGRGRHDQPALLLGRKPSLAGLQARDPGQQSDGIDARRLGLGGEGDHRRGIAQRPAIVAIPVGIAGLALQGRLGLLEGIGGPCLIAVEGERRADLGLGQRRGQLVDLIVGDIAQGREILIAHRGQDIERISPGREGVGIVLVAALGKIGEPAQPVLIIDVGNVIALGLGPGQEIHGIGREPWLHRAGGAPEGEAAVVALHLQDMVDRLLDPHGRRQLRRCAPELGDIGDIEQRHGPAGGLLQAAIGVELELAQQAGHVEIRQAPEARQQLARIGQEAGEGRGIEGHALARLKPLHRALHHRQLGCPDEEHGAVLELHAVRAGDDQMDIGLSHLIAAERHAHHRMAAGIEMLLHIRRLAEGGAADGGEGELIIPRRARDILQADGDLALVAGCQEARHGHGDHDRITDHEPRLARSHFFGIPGDGHQPEPPVVVGNIEMHRGIALGVECHDPRIEGDELDLRRGAAAGKGVGIAALADLAALAVAPVDELAIEVADLHPQAPLAEVPALGRRGDIVGELQDALIHRRQGHIGRVTLGHAAHMDGHVEAAPGRHMIGQGEGDGEAARRGIDSDPGNADGAAGPVVVVVAGPEGGGEDIGPGAPGAVDRHLDGRALGRGIDGPGLDQMIGRDRDQHMTGEGRLQQQGRRLPRLVHLLVGDDLEAVRRIAGTR